MSKKSGGDRTGIIFIIIVAVIGLILGGLAISTPSSNNSTSYDESVVNDNLKFVIGDENAKVKVVIFSDFLCPYCASLHQQIDEMLSSDSGSMAVYTRTFLIHDGAELMSRAAYAAGMQGKYKEASDLLFSTYQEEDPTEDNMIKMAQELGLNTDQFKSDMNSDDAKQYVETDNNDAIKLGLQGTPSVFINGKYLDDLGQFEATVAEASK